MADAPGPVVPVGRAVRVRVPATSANLGPGFDTLGLALNVHDELEVTATESGIAVDVSGVGATAGEGGDAVPTDESNLVARSVLHVFDRVGIAAPGLRIVATNSIPHGRGLGSSGAAIVSGVLAAKGLLEGIVDVSDEDVLRFATELEGHPDNVAPAIFGGLTIAWVDETGPRHKQLAVHRGVSLLVAVPEATMSTKLARSLQPDAVPHADAVFNLSRSALLVAALTQSPELLLDATEDRLHQAYRASAMPDTSALVAELRAAGHAAVVSGAGPSVLVLASDPAARLEAARLVEERSGGAMGAWRARLLAVDIRGGTVEPVPTGAAA
ncbi:homoserine kinase [Agrococcus sp. HG114]|uniref:homoserine kinase n=1 Tax=Agrococcus sp. HG114 TaxID=2969757 RepID=UPI00215AEF87|nr:homoserine kinase [Agrococcus sp. HG114]MCR8671685.1 homoserine kinase [Agrococcus sp. HG114]